MKASVERQNGTARRERRDADRGMAIPLGGPSIEAGDLRAVSSVLMTGSLVQGRVVEAFEARLAEWLGARHVVAVSSGTAALHLAFRALGAGPGDEVIVPAFIFPATANVVEWLGARPVFCDIAPDGFNAGPEEFARVLTQRTRAVMPVHAFGTLADVPAITRAIARTGRGQRPVTVVEDAACALGSSLGGVSAGLLGDAGCLSFHPRKILTTGEGGVILTRRRAVADRVRAMRSHGLVRTKGRFEPRETGLNYRMTDFQATLGLSQVDRLQLMLATRARLASRYRSALRLYSQVRVFPSPPDRIEACQAFVVMFRTVALRERVQAALAAAGIETTFGTYCVPLMKYYRRRYDLEPRMFPNAWAAHRRTLALPLHSGLSPGIQARVLDALREVLS